MPHWERKPSKTNPIPAEINVVADTPQPSQAALPEPPQATTRFTLAQALIGSELMDRLLEYSKTKDDPRQLAQAWAHRIADWIDHHEGWTALPEPSLDVELLAEAIRQSGDPHDAIAIAAEYARLRGTGG